MKNLLLAGLCVIAVQSNAQQPGTVKSYYKVDVGPGSALADSPGLWNYLGYGGCSIRDVDGDTNPELMVVSVDALFRGDIHQVRLNSGGSAKQGFRYINPENLPPNPFLIGSSFYNFGFSSITNLGDLDSNGYDDIAVGNPDGAGSKGEFYIFFMNAAGSFDSLKQIRENAWGLATTLPNQGGFGISPARIGDVDGDGVSDIAVGQTGFDNGRGQIWILFMRKDGRVKNWTTISSSTPNFMTLPAAARFGRAICGIGDLDKDGIPDLMAASPGLSSTNRGAIWTLFLNANGTLKNYKYYAPGSADFPDTVQFNSGFAYGLDAVGDLDGDSVTDIAIGEPGYNDGTYLGSGRVWTWLMNADGTIKGWQKITRSNSNITSLLARHGLGTAVFRLGDFDKDGVPDVAVGAAGDDAANPADTNRNSGAIYLLKLNGVPVTTRVGDVLVNKTNMFYVYPNPAADQVVIRGRDHATSIHSIRIIDVAGRTIRDVEVNSQMTAMPVADLTPGSYFIQIRASNSTHAIQFIKQ